MQFTKDRVARDRKGISRAIRDVTDPLLKVHGCREILSTLEKATVRGEFGAKKATKEFPTLRML